MTISGAADPSSFHAAATIILAREAAAGMELLLLGRSSETAHFPGAWVFPGGTLQPADYEAQARQRVIGLSEEAANLRLGVTADALAFWVAAARECFEEAGILLAVDAQHRALSPAQVAAFSSQRAALNGGTLRFNDFLSQHELYIPAGEMAYVAHWITPANQTRRFNTRFLLMHAPAGQLEEHDNHEIVRSLWLSPAEALSRSQRGELNMVRATQSTIADMNRFASPQAALEHFHGAAEIPENRPCLAQGRDGPKVFGQGDAPYAEVHWVDPQESGQSSYDLVADVPKRLDAQVIRILAPNPGFMTGPGTNTYLVGDRERIAIDPGPDDPAHIAAIVQAGEGRIRWIALTHTHRDHSPAAVALREATGAQIVGRPAGDRTRDADVPFDRVLHEGDTVGGEDSRLQVVHTPGHASNHLCYLLSDTRMLFTGDHIIQGSTVVIAPPDGSMQAYLSSLRRLGSLDVAIMAPGHGYLIGRPQHEIARLIAHRLAREAKVRAALRALGDGATLNLLLPKVYDDVPAAIHPVAARSLRAHLDKMVRDGELLYADESWSLARRIEESI
jgi:glyoxylase-like metal-dependent hydrolase (beta-lactamase superfamily II)/8-oxo-dGTP pyrophosphatase MutT (NUDIX family)